MTPTLAPALLSAALAAAERGWPVFPLRPGDKRPAGHPERNCPRTGRCADGHRTPEQRATLEPGQIAQCWQAAPYNVGIATGPAGLLVVDLDIPKDATDTPPPAWDGMNDGLDVFAALCERVGERLPTETFTVRTRRGGQHLYFTAPAGKQLRGSAGRLGWKVDTRAWGGYVVAAGSIVGGAPYEIIHDAPPAPLPTWLCDLLTPPPAPAPLSAAVIRSRIGRADRYAAAALNGEVAKLQAAATGTQNTMLYNAAYALGRLIAAGTLTEQEVTDTLTGVALAKGLAPSRVAASIRDGIRRSGRNAAGVAA
ncbi:bifunctional DNA primase/polymerase [Streptomyces sp. WAC06614]|uniref:bifunctional DNA primase/polymerase n=1 Tax=Streptomyces sp. WAC06614 TaxID=2487416 RepID=UPI000F794141|nr:bifunctional DNA primase/polymerase [Streptomyces sp. WAC06614]RSS79500.1 DNA primase [Streptomyces sp. WAC06614]